MARVVLGSYVVQFPMGGYLSWVRQWAVGLQRLGHEVFLFERVRRRDACFDPTAEIMGDDATYGIRVVHELLASHGLGDRWCFVDRAGLYHGLDRRAIESVIASADAYLDMGEYGGFEGERASAGVTVLLDGEPGTTQILMLKRASGGEPIPAYDHHFTVGQDVGTDRSTAPTAGRVWGHFFDPVCLDLFDLPSAAAGAPYTTVMSWQARDPVMFDGRSLGMKDREFEKFVELPGRTKGPFEVAVAGRGVPIATLAAYGWSVADAHEVTLTQEAANRYLAGSRGHFGVCKEVFVALHTGWFGDREARYLAAGRPVILQETGFSGHLPCGEGLFAVRDLDEATAAVEVIEADYGRHARAARELARAYLAADVVLSRLLDRVLA